MKKRILLVENQYSQFDTLQRHLSVDFEVFPRQQPLPEDNIAEFKALLDLIRVALNPRYKNGQSSRAFEEFVKYVIATDPDIFIIDHKLVGHGKAGTGIELMKDLRSFYPPERDMPVLFVSRTPRDKIEVIKGLEGLKSKEWVDKQYYAGTLLDEVYVKDVIIPTINKLLEKVAADELGLERVKVMVTIQEMLNSSKLEKAMEELNVVRSELLEKLNNLPVIPQSAIEHIEKKFIEGFPIKDEAQLFINYLQSLLAP